MDTTATPPPKSIPKKAEWHRAKCSALALEAGSQPVGVDRSLNIISGMVLAQEGVFREPDPRGEFDHRSLQGVVDLAAQKNGGLKSRFTHPSLSGDGLGSFLGRVHNVRLSAVTLEENHGDIRELMAVRGDLHLNPSAFNTPNGDLATYVMDLAESDPDAISSSLVLRKDEEFRVNELGEMMLDDNGNSLPPLWRPTVLHASDIVDTGAAVAGLLSADIDALGLPDGMVRQACDMLAGFLPGASREVVEARLQAWLSEAMDFRFAGEEDSKEKTATVEDLKRVRKHRLRKA